MGQKDIASFFGGKPAAKALAAAPSSAGKSIKSKKASPQVLRETSNAAGKKRAREDAPAEPAESAEVPAMEPAGRAASGAGQGKPGLKRLRKGPAVTAASPAKEAENPILDDDLMKAADAQAKSPSPTKPADTPKPKASATRGGSPSTTKKRAKAPPTQKGPKASPKPAAAAAASADPLKLGVDPTAPGDEVEQEVEEAASPARSGTPGAKAASPGEVTGKPTKKPVLPPSVRRDGKVEGVGLGAQAAAAQHNDFDVAKLATWQAGTPVPFGFLANTYEAIAEESKRLVITRLLVNAFRAIIATTPEDLLPAVYLCTNRVGPSHEGLELGVGDSILMKALGEATGKSPAQIKKMYEQEGDLGVVAATARSKQNTLFKPKALTLRAVFKTFQLIATTEGHKSQDKKKGHIVKLLAASKDNEAGYIMRALQGKLRIGLAEQTVLVALGHAVLLQRDQAPSEADQLAGALEEAAQIVKYVYSQCPSYDQMVPALLEHPIAELKQRVGFIVGVPVKPMLAKATNGVSEVLDKFQDIEFTCEYKYDGERAQIHITQNRKMFIYSRNSENMTQKYPDLAARVPQLLKEGVQDVVLDCECVAYDRETKKIMPFQILSTRKRKDVEVADIKVQVCLYAFDCLYQNGEVLVDRPLTERRELLYNSLSEKEGELLFAEAKTSAIGNLTSLLLQTSRDTEELSTFLDDAVKHGTEGLIVKTLDSTYEPSKRSAHWLKLKKDYLKGVGDTFDLVPIGAWHGKGKRVGVYGAYLLAIWNAEAEEFQTISKIGTGFSEERLKELTEQLNPHQISKPHSYYSWGEGLEPDVWFDAKYVWEVKAADLSISPVHRAAYGMLSEARGISIRFPRLLRVRDDKDADQATGADQVVEWYQKQALASKPQVNDD
eukprot:jgi/Astpho2/9808/Aster-03779